MQIFKQHQDINLRTFSNLRTTQRSTDEHTAAHIAITECRQAKGDAAEYVIGGGEQMYLNPDGWGERLGIWGEARGETRARVALRALCRTPRGSLQARGEFKCRLAGKAIILDELAVPSVSCAWAL